MVGKSDYRQYTLLLNVKDVNTLPKGLKSKLVKSLENNSFVGLHGRVLRDYDDERKCYIIKIVMGNPYGKVLDWELLEETIKNSFENYYEELLKEEIGPPTSSKSVYLRPLFVGDTPIKARRTGQSYASSGIEKHIQASNELANRRTFSEFSSSTIPLHRSQLSESDLIFRADEEELLQNLSKPTHLPSQQVQFPFYQPEIDPSVSQLPVYSPQFCSFPFYQQMMYPYFPFQQFTTPILKRATGELQIGQFKLDKSTPQHWSPEHIKLVLKYGVGLNEKQVSNLEISGHELESLVVLLMACKGDAGSSSSSNRNHQSSNQSPLLRLTRYEHMNDLARMFFEQHSELLPTTSLRSSSNSTLNNNPSPIFASNSNNSNSNSILNNVALSPNVTTPPRKITSQKQQRLNAVEHTLKTPSEWKEGLDDMPIILVNMIEDNNLVRLSPESRLALLISGDGDSQEYLSVLPSHKPKTLIHQDRKLKPYIQCKFNDKLMNGEIITRGSSKFIEINIDTLYSTFFPADNIAKYENTKIIELEIFTGKQTKSFSFNCCKTKSTRNLKRTTIIYGASEARIKNQTLQNEEKVRKTIDRLSDQSSSCSSSNHTIPKLVDVKPSHLPTIHKDPPTSDHVHIPQHVVSNPQQVLQQHSTPRKITRETLDHNGRVTNVITEYYNNDSPKKKMEPLVPLKKANTPTPREVISLDDEVTVTPSRKKRKSNINTNNSVILIEDEEKPPVRSIKPKQEETVIAPISEPTTPKKTISFSSVINLDD